MLNSFLSFNVNKCSFSSFLFSFLFWSSFFLLALKVKTISSHIGERCSLFGMCIPFNIHIYCDDNRICRCRPETPVIVGPHQCKRNKSYGDKCSTNQECIYSDNNSFCDSNLCNCVTNHTYDPYLMKCLHSSSHQHPGLNVYYTLLSSPALWIILALIALFISLPCCLAFIYHCVCFEKSMGESSLFQESSIRLRLSEIGSNSNEEGRESNGNLMTLNGTTEGTPFSPHGELSCRQSYESTCLDEPPPSYDEACKQCQPDEPILTNDQNEIQNLMPD